jgi:DeoR/GlpR family transcriptional regulator of sugar metabolism
MQRSATTILAADSSKFLQTGLVELCHISEIAHLVTDQLPNPQLEELARANTQVVLA